jgi:hypothetical protein
MGYYPQTIARNDFTLLQGNRENLARELSGRISCHAKNFERPCKIEHLDAVEYQDRDAGRSSFNVCR